jgi:hypothetical protein
MKASSWPYSTVVAASRKKTTPSAVATTVNSANLVSYPLLYNHVPMSVSSSSPYASSSPYNSVPVSVSSSIGSMGVSANIISLPQPDQSCYLKIQTTVLIRFHSIQLHRDPIQAPWNKYETKISYCTFGTRATHLYTVGVCRKYCKP